MVDEELANCCRPVQVLARVKSIANVRSAASVPPPVSPLPAVSVTVVGVYEVVSTDSVPVPPEVFTKPLVDRLESVAIL